MLCYEIWFLKCVLPFSFPPKLFVCFSYGNKLKLNFLLVKLCKLETWLMTSQVITSLYTKHEDLRFIPEIISVQNETKNQTTWICRTCCQPASYRWRKVSCSVLLPPDSYNKITTFALPCLKVTRLRLSLNAVYFNKISIWSPVVS